ncbi:MAG: S-adenosylmethionine:tRNA ribosyltransferase-isomerase, partial [Bacteroidia bacterium]|nr:S-adenosylmethionine:tRNA ribosyltransferase-isomerase [Bacteroidia bacterium]
MKSNRHNLTEPQENMNIEETDISAYNYRLPEERIAQYPVSNRDLSKLLVYKNNQIGETLFCNIADQLHAGHLLVFNNTKVVRARLNFKKETGSAIEIFCIEPINPSDYERSFSAKGQVVWKCIIGNLKKWKKGILRQQFHKDGLICTLSAEKLSQVNDTCEILFSWDCQSLTFASVLEGAGHIPLPPYISRNDNSTDADRYQTIYAQVKGSVAAPTAGLHFTEKVFENLRIKGIKKADITLHVGAGTFQPIKAERISEHKMHCEHFIIDIKTIENIFASHGQVIAVGTTSVRTLESLYWIGVQLLQGKSFQDEISVEQWEPYENESSHSAENALKALTDYMRKSGISTIEASTSIMIMPGYKFRIINGIIT